MFTFARDFKYTYSPLPKAVPGLVFVLSKGTKFEAGFEHNGEFLTIPCTATATDEEIGAAIRDSLK